MFPSAKVLLFFQLNNNRLLFFVLSYKKRGGVWDILLPTAFALYDLCMCPDDYYGGYYGDDYADSTTEDGDSNYDVIRVYEGYSY